MDEKAIELVVKKLEELGSNYGPAFTDAAINYAHIKAFEYSVIPLLVCVVATFLCRFFYKKVRPTTYDNFYYEVLCPVLSGTSGLVAIGSFLSALEPAAWYGLFEPKAYLAYRLFEKVL